MVYLYIEKKLVHSPLLIALEKPCMWQPIPLLVISSAHGQVSYKWEKKSLDWEDIAVPPFTCPLYVDTAQQYKCTVDGESFIFNVQGILCVYLQWFIDDVNYAVQSIPPSRKAKGELTKMAFITSNFFHVASEYTIISTTESAVDHKEITYDKIIGCGGFDSVYRGKWKAKDVALKEIHTPAGIDKEQITATSRELKVLRQAYTLVLPLCLKLC